MLDGTVVGTALPRTVEQIGGGDSWYVWLVTAYPLTSSVGVPGPRDTPVATGHAPSAGPADRPA